MKSDVDVSRELEFDGHSSVVSQHGGDFSVVTGFQLPVVTCFASNTLVKLFGENYRTICHIPAVSLGDKMLPSSV